MIDKSGCIPHFALLGTSIYPLSGSGCVTPRPNGLQPGGPCTVSFHGGFSQALFIPLTLQQNGTLGAGGNLNVGGSVSAGTLSANSITSGGGITAAGDVSAGGKIGMGLQQVSETYTMSSYSIASYSCSCPAGTRALAGGGGHRDYNFAQSDITVNFSGPLSDGSGWQVLLDNSALTASRTVIVWAICARVQ